MKPKKPHSDRPEKKKTKSSDKREQDAELEKALEDTFPSSDPVALTQPTIAAKKKPRR